LKKQWRFFVIKFPNEMTEKLLEIIDKVDLT